MKYLKISACFFLCLILLASCGQNLNRIKDKLESCPEDMMYAPEMFSYLKNVENVNITTSDSMVTYFYTDEISCKNYKYRNINLHLKKHNSDLNKKIDSLVDSFVKEEDSAVNAVKHEFNGVGYAFTYEIRTDYGHTVMNIIFPVSKSVSAYYTLQLIEIPDKITSEILDKICADISLTRL